MKISVQFRAMDLSAIGMGIQRDRMDLIAENIANSESTRMDDGWPYRRKVLYVSNKENPWAPFPEFEYMHLKTTDDYHYPKPKGVVSDDPEQGLETDILEDATPGDIVYMPNHPDANEDGYVQMPNVDVVTEMVDMITATRGFEANMTAFNASKQIAKDSLEI